MRNRAKKEMRFANCLEEIREAVSGQSTIEDALKQAVVKTADFDAVFEDIKPDANCCDPVIGGLQNSLTRIVNKRHPVGGLAVHIDTDTVPKAIRITQHPDAGDFEEIFYLARI